MRPPLFTRSVATKWQSRSVRPQARALRALALRLRRCAPALKAKGVFTLRASGGLCAAAFLVLGACDAVREHRVAPDAAEARAIEELEKTFLAAAESGQTDALKGRVDVPGRVALLELTQTLAESGGTTREEKKNLLMAAAMLMGGEGAFTGDEVKSAAWGTLKDKLGDALDLDPLDQAVLDVLIGKRVSEPKEEQEAGILERLQQADVSRCRPGKLDGAWSGELLEKLETPKTEKFGKWKSRLRTAHLKSIDCGDRHGLLLLTDYKDRDAPLLAAWKFFSQEEWDALSPKLERGLRQ